MSRAKPAQAHPTEFSCPDCIGVLKLARDGPNHRDYRCQVGHHFSTRSLLIAKEKELERSLWSSAALLEHIMQVNERFLKETKLEEKGRRRLQKRIREARQQKAVLIRLVEHTHAWE